MKHVVFVCVENFNRSQMAEALARVRDLIGEKVRELLAELGGSDG